MADRTVDSGEVRARIGELIAFVREGHEILISDGDEPVARLGPVRAARAGSEPLEEGATERAAEGPDPPARRRKRTLGLTPGAAHMAPDFDDPLPDSFWLGES